MDAPTTYAVKLEVGRKTHYLSATFRADVSEVADAHPIDLFGPIFRASLIEAGLAFADPKVREVPIYRAGELKPVAYLTRAKP